MSPPSAVHRRTRVATRLRSQCSRGDRRADVAQHHHVERVGELGSAAARLWLATGLRRERVRYIGKVHRGAALTHIEEIGDAHFEDLCKVEEDLDRRIPHTSLKFLEVPVGDSGSGDILLR